MFGRKDRTAEELDGKALRNYETGRKIAGKVGGRVGDAVSNATLARARRRHDPVQG